LDEYKEIDAIITEENSEIYKLIEERVWEASEKLHDCIKKRRLNLEE
jgi:hypothetical protein